MARISFIISEVEKICELAKVHNRKIMLVKDEGIYIVGQFFKGDNIEEKTIAYAKGYNPNIDGEWYDKAHNISANDFVDYPPIGVWMEELKANKPKAKTFTINVTSKTISLVL